MALPFTPEQLKEVILSIREQIGQSNESLPLAVADKHSDLPEPTSEILALTAQEEIVQTSGETPQNIAAVLLGETPYATITADPVAIDAVIAAYWDANTDRTEPLEITLSDTPYCVLYLEPPEDDADVTSAIICSKDYKTLSAYLLQNYGELEVGWYTFIAAASLSPADPVTYAFALAEPDTNLTAEEQALLTAAEWFISVEQYPAGIYLPVEGKWVNSGLTVSAIENINVQFGAASNVLLDISNRLDALEQAANASYEGLTEEPTA
jgi:hypothetical protein